MVNLFNRAYPYLDEHELNLDWLIAKMKELNIRMDEFEVVNSISFSGAWDITKQYPAWTIVDDGGMGYVSIRPVPAGIDINNVNYWRLIADYSIIIAGLAGRISDLEVTVGNENSGLVHDVADITEKFNNLTILNVKDFGAIGDGITDDTQAFDDAIAYGESLITGKTLITATNTELAAYALYIPSGCYIIKHTLTFNKVANQEVGAIYENTSSCVRLYGEGLSSILNFEFASAGDGLVFEGNFVSVENIKISSVPGSAIVLKGWGFNLKDVFVNDTTNTAFLFMAHTFIGRLDHCIAFHAQNGFYAFGFSTSLVFTNCYANGCSDYGFGLGVNMGCVYSTLTSCAVDGGKYPYTFGPGSQITMISCGHEQSTVGSVIQLSGAGNLIVEGFYDYNSTTSLLGISDNSKATLDNVISYSDNDANISSIITSSGNATDMNSVIMRNCEIRGTRSLWSGGCACCITSESIGAIRGDLDANGEIILGTLKSLGNTTTITGDITIMAWQGNNSEAIPAVYKIAVAGVPTAYILNTYGKGGPNGAVASWASYTFSIDNNGVLKATHDAGSSAAGRTVLFDIVMNGNLSLR